MEQAEGFSYEDDHMIEEAPIDAPLVIKSKNKERYARGFVTHIVCELRFPTILELANARPPAEFVRALRREYPILEASKEVTVNLGKGTSESRQAHVFRANKSGWWATLKHSSVAIESRRYSGYADFRQRVKRLVDAATPVVDSDLWMRVGLRLVNTISGDPADDWVNPQLVGPIVGGDLNGFAAFGGAFQLGTDELGCSLRHQLQLTTSELEGDKPRVEYVVDIDAYQTDVDITATLSVLDDLHARAFDLFDWSLGEAARTHLSK